MTRLDEGSSKAETVVHLVFVIADLAGYTALTEAHGGEEAATTVARYRQLAEQALAKRARVVEQVGDQLLIVADDARTAIVTAARLRAAVAKEPHFLSVRVGVADGLVVRRDGRYFGPAINLTARLAARAAVDEVLCTTAVARACGDVNGLVFIDLGALRFRNVPEPVVVSAVVSRQARHDAAVVDPVCWMHLEPGTAPARLPFGDTTYYFCSFACARAFAEHPRTTDVLCPVNARRRTCCPSPSSCACEESERVGPAARRRVATRFGCAWGTDAPARQALATPAGQRVAQGRDFTSGRSGIAVAGRAHSEEVDMRPTAFALSLMAMFLFLTGPASGGDMVQHSGVIVAIADDGRTFVLAEVGPWQVRDGATVVTNRTIRLLPETTFAMVGRVDDAPSGFPGDFIEIPLVPEAVYLNDYVTVDCRHEGKKMFALKITVTELPDAETAGQTLR